MMDATNYQAMTLFASVLGVETIGALTRKNLLTAADASEIFDRVLLNFETQAGVAAPDEQAAIAVARQLCEASLAQLAKQGRTHQ